jgi:hypothetical protein
VRANFWPGYWQATDFFRVDELRARQAHPGIGVHEPNTPPQDIPAGQLRIRVQIVKIAAPAEGQDLVVGHGEPPVIRVHGQMDPGIAAPDDFRASIHGSVVDHKDLPGRIRVRVQGIEARPDQRGRIVVHNDDRNVRDGVMHRYPDPLSAIQGVYLS